MLINNQLLEWVNNVDEKGCKETNILHNQRISFNDKQSKVKIFDDLVKHGHNVTLYML